MGLSKPDQVWILSQCTLIGKGIFSGFRNINFSLWALTGRFDEAAMHMYVGVTLTCRLSQPEALH